jgi:WD40 repeat protein
MNLAQHAWEQNNLVRTRQLLDQHRPKPGEDDLRGFEWYYLRRLFHGELQVVQAHGGTVTAVAFTPDGKRLISCGRSQARQDMNYGKDLPHEIKLWEVATGRQLPLGIKGPTDKARWAALSPDGTRLAAACEDQGIRVWDLATGEPSTLERQAKESDDYVGFSANGKRLVSMSTPDGNSLDHTVRVWDVASHKVIARVEKLAYAGNPPEFSPDGTLVAVVDYGQRVVKVFEVATAREAFSCKYGEGRVSHAVFSPDGKRLAACGERGLRLWDVASRELVATWPTATNVGYFLAYSPDGRHLALGGIEGAVELWNTGTGRKVATFNGHAGLVRMVAFSPDGIRLASAGVDGTLRVWDTTGRRESVPLSSNDSNTYLALSPDGQTVFTLIVMGKSIRFWDATTGEPRGEPIPIDQSPLLNSSHDWTADGKHLFFADSGKHIKVCDVVAGKVVGAFPVDSDGQGVLAVSPDGKWCAHPVSGGTIKVRNAETGAECRTVKGLEGQVHNLVFSPDGSGLLGTDKSGALKIWERATGRVTAATRLDNVFVWRIRYSPDGKRLVVVGVRHQSLSGEVRILDAESGRELLALRGHTLNVTDAAFSPDGQRLATCSLDRTVRLWDLAAGQEILTLRGHTLAVQSLRFISDGHRLLSASGDRTVRVWDATPLAD